MNRLFDNIPFLKGKIPGKITLSCLLFVYAVILLCICKRADRVWIAFAMFASFIGDICLNYTSISNRKKKDFILGALFFAIAHLFYIMAYSKIEGISNVFNPLFFSVVIFIAFTIAIPFVAIVFRNKNSKVSLMHVVALLYLVIISLNCATVISCSCSFHSIRSIAAFGAISFFISDLFIGMETFLGVKSKTVRELVWWFYPIGQFLLITMG